MEENNATFELVELENHLILRLPLLEANKVRNFLRKKPAKLKKHLKIDINPTTRVGHVYCGKKVLNATLKKLPTIIESNKTITCNTKSIITKTADICEMLECTYEPQKENFDYPHGITPPLKNVRKNRFRKTLRNSEEAIEVEGVMKELYYLFRADYEAISSRFQVIYEENKENTINAELVLFGHISTDSQDSDTNSIK